MTQSGVQRKHLLLAQMMLERAELAAELDNVRHAAAPPQLARGLWSSVLGQAAGSGLLATLVGSLLRRARSRPARAKSAAAASAPASLLNTLLAPYPLLGSAVAALWPLLRSKRALKRLAIGAGIAAAVWQLRRLRRG